MQVQFGETQARENEKIDFSTAQKPLSLGWEAFPNKYYTLVMYDISAPTPENPANSPYLHLLTVNIPGMDIPKGNIVVSYVPPSPPSGSAPHMYIIDIYEQPGLISLESVTDRVRYDLAGLVNRTGLVLTKRFSFFVEAPQEYQPKASWLKSETGLSEPKQKFCRCVLDVASKQPESCNRERAWYQVREGRMCYNPYSVCAKSVGTTSRKCGESYDFENIPDDQLVAYASLNRIEVPRPYDRTKMLENIYRWKLEE